MAIGSGLVTISSKNPVVSAMALVFHFFMLAGLYLTLNAQFIAVIQILVYAGAIMVLVVFVIMLLNLGDEQKFQHKWTYRKPVAWLLSLALIGQIAAVFLAKPLTSTALPQTINYASKTYQAGSVELIGQVLFNDYLFPFEAISLLLLAALIGSIILAKKRI